MVASLPDLPVELVSHISSFIHPPALVDFALTCKRVHQCALKQLVLNQEYHAMFRACHDRQPLNVPALLHRVLNDGDAAWHMRCFEFWGERSQWEKWTSFHDYDDPEVKNWLEPFEDFSALDESFFSAEEICQYRDIISTQLLYGSSVNEIEEWMRRIARGDDKLLKCILVAMAPRVENIKFVHHQEEEPMRGDPLIDLGKSIRNCWTNSVTYGSLWAPGFASLRSVSVCASTDMRNPAAGFYAPPSAVAPLFLLPNIESLNLNQLGNWNMIEDEDYDLPAGCSSVKDLTFNSAELSHGQYMKLIRSSAHLRSLTLTYCSLHLSELVEFLAENHKESLEVLRLSDERDSIPFHRIYDPRLLRKFSKLKVFQPLYLSLIHSAPDANGVSPQWTSSEFMPEGTGRQIADLRRILPPTLEHVYFTAPTYKPGLLSEDFPKIIKVLGDLAEDDQFAKLRTIDMSGVKGHTYRTPEGPVPVKPLSKELWGDSGNWIAESRVNFIEPGDDEHRADVFKSADYELLETAPIRGSMEYIAYY